MSLWVNVLPFDVTEIDNFESFPTDATILVSSLIVSPCSKELVSVEGYTGEYGNISYNNYSFTSTISIDNYGVDPDEMLNEFSFTVKVVYNEYS